MRHAIERHGLAEAGIGIAAAAPVPPAVFLRAAPPQGERVAIALLLPRLLGGKPRGIFHARGNRLCCRFAQTPSLLFCVPSPLVGEGREGGRHCEERQRRTNPGRIPELDCFAALRGARNDATKSRSRGAPWRPSYATPLSEIVTTDFDPVVHAEFRQASAGGKHCASVTSAWMPGAFKLKTALRAFCPGMTKERTKGKDSEAKRRQTQGSSAVPDGHGRAPIRGAHHLSAFHRGSRPEESFIARDSAPGFCFLGRGLSVEWALPTPAYPSPARSSRPGHSAKGLMPNAARERVAKPRAGTALAPGLRPAGRNPSDWARFGLCNVFSDIRQVSVTITVT
jgi:hypothetical protein